MGWRFGNLMVARDESDSPYVMINPLSLLKASSRQTAAHIAGEFNEGAWCCKRTLSFHLHCSFPRGIHFELSNIPNHIWNFHHWQLSSTTHISPNQLTYFQPESCVRSFGYYLMAAGEVSPPHRKTEYVAAKARGLLVCSSFQHHLGSTYLICTTHWYTRSIMRLWNHCSRGPGRSRRVMAT